MKTDTDIDAMSGAELQRAVAEAKGWYEAEPIINGTKRLKCLWHDSMGPPEEPYGGANCMGPAYWHTDLNAAWELVVDMPVAVIVRHDLHGIVTNTRVESCERICRAWLKWKHEQ